MADDTVEIRLEGDASSLRSATEQAGQSFQALLGSADQLDAGLTRLAGNLQRAVATFRDQSRDVADAARDVQQTVRSIGSISLDSSLGPELSRSLISASDSAKTFAKSLSVAAAGDAEARDAAREHAAALGAVAMSTEAAAQKIIGYEAGTRRAADSAAAFAKELRILNQEQVSISAARSRTSAEPFARDLTGFQASGKSAAASASVFVETAARDEATALAAVAMSGEAAAQKIIGFETSTRRAADAAAVFTKELRLLSREQVAVSQAQSRNSTEAFAQQISGFQASGRSAAESAEAFTQAGIKTRSVLGLNRMGMLEMQAAGVNSFQALASGMNPFHVAVMEGAQALGALIQGGLFSFQSVAVGMVSTTGALAVGFGAVAVAVGVMAFKLAEAEAAMRGLHNEAILQGRDAFLVESSAQSRARGLDRTTQLGFSEARTGAVAIEKNPGLSPNAQKALEESFGALTVQFGGSAEKAAKAVSDAFSSPDRMKAFVDENRLLTGELKLQFDKAVAQKDSFRASEIAAAALRDRLAEMIKVLREVREEYDRTAGATGPAGEFISYETLLQARLQNVTGSPFRFPNPTPGPSPEDQRSDHILEERTKRQRDLGAAIADRKLIQDRVDRGAYVDTAQLEAAKNAIKELDDKIKELSRDPKDPTPLRAIEAAIERQSAAIAAAASAAGTTAGAAFTGGFKKGTATELLGPFAVGNAKVGGPSSIERVDPAFAGQIATMADAMPPEIRDRFKISSGFRDAARQAEVNPGVTHSQHVEGRAVDINNDAAVIAWIKANGSRFGLGFPLDDDPKERNHLESVTNGVRGATPARPRDMEAIRKAQLENEVRERERVLADETATAGLYDSEKLQLQEKLESAKRQLAEQTARINDRHAQEDAQRAMGHEREKTAATEQGTQARIAAIEKELEVARSQYGGESPEALQVETRLAQAKREAAQNATRDRVSDLNASVQTADIELQEKRNRFQEEVAERKKTAVEGAQAYRAAVEEQIQFRKNKLREIADTPGLNVEQQRSVARQLAEEEARANRERAVADRGIAQARRTETGNLTSDRISDLNASIQAGQLELQEKRNILQEEVAQRKKTAVEAARAYRASVEEQVSFRKSKLQEIAGLPGLSPEQKRTVNKQLTEEDPRANKERAEADRGIAQAERTERNNRNSDRISDLNASIQAGQLILQEKRNHLQEEVADRKLSAVEAAQAYRAAVEQEVQSRRRTLQEIANLENLTPEQRRAVNKQLAEEDARANKERAEADRALAQARKAEVAAYAADFKSALGSLGSSIKSSISGVLSGDKTIAQARADIGKAVVSSGVDFAGSVASKAAAGPVGGLLGVKAQPGEGVGDVVGTWAGNKLGNWLFDSGEKTATDVAGATASAPILSAGIVTGATLAAPILTAAIVAGGAGAGAEESAFKVATTVAVAAVSMGGIIPRAAGGMTVPRPAAGMVLPSSFGKDRTLSALQPDELVLPVGERPSAISAHLSDKIDALSQAGNRSGFALHIHGGNNDGPSIERWFRGNMMRNGDVVDRITRSVAAKI